MRGDVRLVERLSDELVATDGAFGRQVWATSKLRKTRRCMVCSSPMQPGVQAFRPVGNARNRMERVCLRCWGQKEAR